MIDSEDYTGSWTTFCLLRGADLRLYSADGSFWCEKGSQWVGDIVGLQVANPPQQLVEFAESCQENAAITRAVMQLDWLRRISNLLERALQLSA